VTAARPGVVYLVGAGPGDPGLMTLRAAELLAGADTVLYDRLIPRLALARARPDAELVYVGKEPASPQLPQDEIERLMIDRARAGRSVVRLKGGDPFVFGRGGEEAQALARARVPFRIVPGITAGIGGLAYAGIPVTHRDTNHAVTFITGHGADGKLTKLDWDAAARGAPTLVFYMARKFAGEISRNLIAAGRDRNEPAAIVANAAREDQQVFFTTLGELPAAAENAPALAIMVIGENVRLAKELNWLAEAVA
jgi:uroporphyrin-III C-methyltransferase